MTQNKDGKVLDESRGHCTDDPAVAQAALDSAPLAVA
jgi:hypothetical protein